MANLRRALSRLKSLPQVKLRQVSSIYESEPVDHRGQPDFLNGVCKIATRLPPGRLLPLLQTIEKEVGRRNTVPKGPRIIDLDILLYDDLVLAQEELTIPHPGLHQRKFVLLPLLEISPDLPHPSLGKRLDELLAELVDESRVELIGAIDDSRPTRERGG